MALIIARTPLYKPNLTQANISILLAIVRATGCIAL